MFRGLVRVQNAAGKPIKLADLLKITAQSFLGLVYMLHWQVVMFSVTARMSIRPKRLKWVKTVHEGSISIHNG
jgi:1,2-diacylglycerol 3-beta-glucosyltransferase